MSLAPAVFWAMSMVEWLCCVEGYMVKTYGPNASTVEPMTRDELEELVERYPDGDRNTA